MFLIRRTHFWGLGETPSRFLSERSPKKFNTHFHCFCFHCRLLTLQKHLHRPATSGRRACAPACVGPAGLLRGPHLVGRLRLAGPAVLLQLPPHPLPVLPVLPRRRRVGPPPHWPGAAAAWPVGNSVFFFKLKCVPEISLFCY